MASATAKGGLMPDEVEGVGGDVASYQPKHPTVGPSVFDFCFVLFSISYWRSRAQHSEGLPNNNDL